MKHHDPQFLTSKQAAAILAPLPTARHPRRVQLLLPRLVRAGLLPTVKLGRGWTRYRATDLRAAKPAIVAWIEEGRKANRVKA